MAAALSLVAGGGDATRLGRGSQQPRAVHDPPFPVRDGERFILPGAGVPTLGEMFAASPRDGGWTGFLLPQLEPGKPLLWVQERMAILESGRLHPPGLGPAGKRFADLIHVEARDARDALWAMEEGLRCGALGAVIGEIWGDPASLDFTATRRLAVAAERHGVAAFLVRLRGTPNLSGARSRWRVASAPSLANPFNARAPGDPSWNAELFRTRHGRPGQWRIAHEPAGRNGDDGPPLAFHLVADTVDRPLGAAFARTG